MNNQMPMGYMPNYNQSNELDRINDKINGLEKRVNKLEKKIQILDNNNMYPMPYNYNMPGFPNNYMM